MMRAAPKPVGVNHLRAFGYYLSCKSELVSGVAGNLDFENSVGAMAPTQNQSPGALSTELAGRITHFFERERK
jgi:hypothetical protein